jgi:hypothetical protein
VFCAAGAECGTTADCCHRKCDFLDGTLWAKPLRQITATEGIRRARFRTWTLLRYGLYLEDVRDDSAGGKTSRRLEDFVFDTKITSEAGPQNI